MFFGAAFWSVYADKHGRRGAFVFSLVFVFIGGLASAVSPSVHALLLFRAAVGFGVGGNIPVTTALVAEFLPTSARANVMCIIAGVFWGSGLACASLLGLILHTVLGAG